VVLLCAIVIITFDLLKFTHTHTHIIIIIIIIIKKKKKKKPMSSPDASVRAGKVHHMLLRPHGDLLRQALKKGASHQKEFLQADLEPSSLLPANFMECLLPDTIKIM
jgi:hypothetical protein